MTQTAKSAAALLIGLALLCVPAYGKKKKDEAKKEKPGILETLDYSKIVWPNPPAITRIKYLDYFAAEHRVQKGQKEKVSWMDRLSGVATGETKADQPRFQLVLPYGIAVDSKGRVYVGDSKVRAVFVFNPEKKDEVELIKNGMHARFRWITGLAIDDADRLFVADSGYHHVVVFDAQRKVEGSIGEGMVDPGGLAIDNENRYLYVADAAQDQVLVYDADPPFKLLRRIGTGGKEHTLTAPGDFAKPTNVAVDGDGNLYVSDTLNFRIEIFDAEGNFLRTFGKAGDGPGYFTRPKGIAIDGDGHIWVADTMQDRVQVFDQKGRLLIYLGEHGLLPGQFRSVVGLAIDKNNRVFTSEQFPGRVQMFRYFSDAEAAAEKEKQAARYAKKPEAAGSQAAADKAQGSVAK